MPKYAYKTLTYFKEGIEALFNLASPCGDYSFYIKFMLILDEVTYLNTELIQMSYHSSVKRVFLWRNEQYS